MLTESEIARLMFALVEGGGDFAPETLDRVIEWANEIKASKMVLDMLVHGEASCAVIDGEICIGTMADGPDARGGL